MMSISGDERTTVTRDPGAPVRVSLRMSQTGLRVAVEQHFPRDGQNVTRLREDQDWGAQDLSGKYLLAVSPRQTRGLLLPTDGDTELTVGHCHHTAAHHKMRLDCDTGKVLRRNKLARLR